MANIKLVGNSWEAEGIFDKTQNKTQKAINSEVVSKLSGIEAGAQVNRTYTATTGKPTANQTPSFGDTVTVSQVTQDATGQISVTDRTIEIPNSTASTSAAGLMSAADKTALDTAVTNIGTMSEMGTTATTLAGGIGELNADLRRAILEAGISSDLKRALVDFANVVAFANNNPAGEVYVDAIEDILYPPSDLQSISAVYTQTNVIREGDSLDALKSDLIVTAQYSGNLSKRVWRYTLSGSLREGTSTITVNYNGKSDTFSVIVSAKLPIYTKTSPFIIGSANNKYSNVVSGYHYVYTSTDRIAYPLFDLLLTGGKTYRFVAESTESAAQMAIQLFNQNLLNSVNSNSDFATADLQSNLPWGELDTTVAISETWNSSPVVGARIIFRKDSNNSTITSVFITKLEIYEVD